MKKKLTVLAVAALIIALLAGGSVAYFTAESQVIHNVITTGGVEVEVVEKAIVDGEEKDFEDVTGVTPGTDVSKIVTMKNTGPNPAYIRMKVDVAVELAQGVSGEPDLSLVGIDYNTADWTMKDGYWYYNKALEPGKSTEPLFTTVSFDPKMGNLYQSSTLTVTVAAQAVQTANNTDSALTAAGWPA